jgi:hypothetical protein
LKKDKILGKIVKRKVEKNNIKKMKGKKNLLILGVAFLVFGAGVVLSEVTPDLKCADLIRNYNQVISKYDENGNGRIEVFELKKAFFGWTKREINNDEMLAIFSYHQQDCSGMREDPIKGSLRVYPLKARVGEEIQVSVFAQDSNGVVRLYAYFNGRWNSTDCVSATLPPTTCTYTFKTQFQSPGEYDIFGYVVGKKVDGSFEGNWTVPKSFKVKVIAPTPTPFIPPTPQL